MRARRQGDRIEIDQATDDEISVAVSRLRKHWGARKLSFRDGAIVVHGDAVELEDEHARDIERAHRGEAMRSTKPGRKRDR